MSSAGWRGVVAATSASSEEMEELQFVCGEGPCIDAFRFGHPVLVDDLQDSVWAGWTGYAPIAQAAGVRAVFAFPLQIGAARLGVLDIYRDVAGSLTAAEIGDASFFADLALNTLLDSQQSVVDGQQERSMEDAFDYRIYQAQGMVSVQLGVDLIEAMGRLRAHALAHDVGLGEVADNVLSGSLRLDSEAT